MTPHHSKHAGPSRPAPRQGALYKYAEVGTLQYEGGAEDDCFDRLARIVEPEDWARPGRDRTWVLREYLEQTFERLTVQRRIAVSADGARSAFATGLATPAGEDVYGTCVPADDPDGPPWRLDGWRTAAQLADDFAAPPEPAGYLDDPAALVYDARLPLRVDPPLLLAEILPGLPIALHDNPHLAGLVLDGAVRRAELRARRSFRLAVPVWDPANERIQLALPLALSAPASADLALTIVREGAHYRGTSVLPPDITYARARQLGSLPGWLTPQEHA